MQLSPQVAAFWGRFQSYFGKVDPERLYEVFYFGNSEHLADSLAELVLAGVKRATTGLILTYETEGKRLPRPGDLSIVTNWAGMPLCVIETERVDIMPFDAVTAEFASVEGEGDGSLKYWREGHIEYFTEECARFGLAFHGTMPVACERFKVLYKEVSGKET